MADGPGKVLFDRQLRYYAEDDIEGLLENNYTEDARLVMFDYQVHGRDQLRQHFKGFKEIAGKVNFKEVEKFVENGNTMLIQVSAETEKLGTMVFIDAFVLQGGKISNQFSIVK